MTVGLMDCRTVGLWLTAALGLESDSPAVRQSIRWRPEERALISDFSSVRAVAASPFTVFAATTRGLTLYDRQARAWRLPVTSLDGYPAAPIRAALADGVDDAVWLGTDDGWARYDATMRAWERGRVTGGVNSFMLDARDQASGIFVQGASGWSFVARGSLLSIPGRPLPPPDQRIQPLDPQAALGQAPMADAMRALLLTDPRLRTYRFTAVARSSDRSDLFFGTDGLGLVRIDPATGEWERLSFGLLAAPAGAVAAGPEGVWVASGSREGRGGRGVRRGITWLATNLRADTAIEGSGVLGFPCVDGRRLLARAGALWLACERGVVKVDAESYRSRLFEVDSPLSLAPAPDGVWVGSRRGLVVITQDERVVPVGELGQAVLSLVAARETLWVGTPSGIGVLAPGTSRVAVSPALSGPPSLRAPTLALGLVHDTLVAVTRDQFAWRDPATHAWTLVQARAELGRITTLAADQGGVWIGGTSGLAFWDLARTTFRTLRVPLDVPAPVRDVAVEPPYLWVATDSGLVRFARDAALR
jgi:ligand-binding sensor domain-containing protein